MQNFIAILITILIAGCGGEGRNNDSLIPYFKVITAQKEDKLQINYTIETNESIEMAFLKLVIKDASGNIFKKDSLYVTDYIDMNSSWKETFTEPLYGFKNGSYSVTIELCDGKNKLLASSENNFTVERDIVGENVYLEEFELQKIYKDLPTRLKSGREASVKIKTNTATTVFVYTLADSGQLELVAEEWSEGSEVTNIDFTIPDSFGKSNRTKVFVTFHPLNGLEEAKKAYRRNGVFFHLIP